MGARAFMAAGAVAALLLTVASQDARAATGAGLGSYEKGKAAFAAGDLRAAAEYFKKAFAAEPEPVYLYNQASCHRRLGEKAIAAKLYEQFLRIVPSGERPGEREKALAYAADLRLQMGIDLRTRGDCTGALAELRRSLEHAPGAAAWMHTGMCREDLGDPGGARVAYESALGAPDLDASVRPAIEARLAALKVSPPALPTALKTPPPSPAGPAKFSPVPVIVIGGAAAAVAAAVIVAVVLTSGKGGGLDLPPADFGPFRFGGW